MSCGYSLEAPHWGTSNEYPHMFPWRNKKNINTFIWNYGDEQIGLKRFALVLNSYST